MKLVLHTEQNCRKGPLGRTVPPVGPKNFSEIFDHAYYITKLHAAEETPVPVFAVDADIDGPPPQIIKKKIDFVFCWIYFNFFKQKFEGKKYILNFKLGAIHKLRNSILTPPS